MTEIGTIITNFTETHGVVACDQGTRIQELELALQLVQHHLRHARKSLTGVTSPLWAAVEVNCALRIISDTIPE